MQAVINYNATGAIVSFMRKDGTFTGCTAIMSRFTVKEMLNKLDIPFIEEKEHGKNIA